MLPFKRKQIEQRELEAEAENAARICTAKGAEARRIEAGGETDSRRKLANADAYRLEQIGKVKMPSGKAGGEPARLKTEGKRFLSRSQSERLQTMSLAPLFPAA